jgi:DNA (cytosine-5)-methyltransferase 1
MSTISQPETPARPYNTRQLHGACERTHNCNTVAGSPSTQTLNTVEICAGAGGQALGLEAAGFDHCLSVELDTSACATLKANRPGWRIAEGDVADPSVWLPAAYEGVPLFAGGVPCPPFSVAGKQLGSTDERDLFAWAVEQVAVVKPRALLLENVRGLSMPRFAGYRQHVLDRLAELGYIAEWQLLKASDYGVPQLRPRFILVALRPEDAKYFHWPEPANPPPTVGAALLTLMEAGGWEGAKVWAARANKIGPTIVGGSKRHGGADLGPTRARRAWADLGVNASSVADAPPQPGECFAVGPRLTTEMVARIQGWSQLYPWIFTGNKTSRYRQIGNAFPPPFAHAVGAAIKCAFYRCGEPKRIEANSNRSLYKALRTSQGFIPRNQLMEAAGLMSASDLEQQLSLLGKDFQLQVDDTGPMPSYRLGKFRGFTGQAEHTRNDAFLKYRARIS